VILSNFRRTCKPPYRTASYQSKSNKETVGNNIKCKNSTQKTSKVRGNDEEGDVQAGIKRGSYKKMFWFALVE